MKCRRLIDSLGTQLTELGDPNVGRVASKWSREFEKLAQSPAFRHSLVAHLAKIRRTAYALVTIALERAGQQVDEQRSSTLTLTLEDLTAELKRIILESDNIDRVLADRGLEMIVGEDLISVTFAVDYLEFDFNGQSLSASTLPSVNLRDKTFQSTTDGYRDALCSLIRATVDRVDIREQDAIEIRFREGSTVHISLRPEDARWPESATFSSRAGGCWVW